MNTSTLCSNKEDGVRQTRSKIHFTWVLETACVTAMALFHYIAQLRFASTRMRCTTPFSSISTRIMWIVALWRTQWVSACFDLHGWSHDIAIYTFSLYYVTECIGGDQKFCCWNIANSNVAVSSKTILKRCSDNLLLGCSVKLLCNPNCSCVHTVSYVRVRMQDYWIWRTLTVRSSWSGCVRGYCGRVSPSTTSRHWLPWRTNTRQRLIMGTTHSNHTTWDWGGNGYFHHVLVHNVYTEQNYP